jgi:hypothetical protein
MALRFAWALVAAVVGSSLVGCSSTGGDHGRPPKPPYPVGAGTCDTYCLVWVPPVYRDVPKVVCCKPGGVTQEKVCVRKTEFDEVCRPGCYEPKRTPDRCRTEEVAVQCAPGSDRWVPTNCPCDCGECFRHERIPPRYRLCDKKVTEKGVEYCAYTPPEYDVVPRVKRVVETQDVYRPAEFGVTWEKELFQCGHWEWRKTDCRQPAPPCVAPRAPRPGFGCCPSKD